MLTNAYLPIGGLHYISTKKKQRHEECGQLNTLDSQQNDNPQNDNQYSDSQKYIGYHFVDCVRWRMRWRMSCGW